MSTSALRYTNAGALTGPTSDNMLTRPLEWALISQVTVPASLLSAFNVSSLADLAVGYSRLIVTMPFANLNYVAASCAADPYSVIGNPQGATWYAVTCQRVSTGADTDGYPQIAMFGPLS